MLATLPASAVLTDRPWRSGVAGTVWNGEVGIAGGSKVEWHWAPLRSLTSLGFAVDWRATGPDTDLGGQALLWPGSWRVDQVSGSADASLLQAAAPGLPFACDLTMQVELPKLVAGGGRQQAQATILSDAGSCTPRPAGAASAVPAMILTAEHVGRETRIRLAPQTQRRQTLVDATLAEDGAYRMTLTGDGARALPFTGLPAGVTVESRL
ncbi:type II secretion system protein N [Sphingomonas sp. ac-8]|uniref:type II secretion system protein N n=1 Tax=Sphingomonas sp. ac-8 TaxID=3242977 RepID=UPI003A80F944